MAAQDCIDAIRRAFKGKRDLSDEDITFILEEMQRRFDETGQGQLGAPDEEWLRIATQIARDVQEAAVIERRNRKLNLLAKTKLLEMAKAADERYGDPSAGIEAALVGINRPLPGGRLSADARSQALFSQYLGGMVADLERADLLVHLNSGEHDLDVARALEKLTRPEARGTNNATANEIAKIIHKHRRIALDRQNKAGAWIKPLKGYITRQSHDIVKVRKAGYEEWRAAVLPLLDEARTFSGHDSADAFLREAYTTIVNGEQLRTIGDEVDLKLAFKGPGNLGKRLSKHRVLHFKDADSWHAYNQKFGTGNIREAVIHELDNFSRNTGLMEVMGTNPRAMFDEVLETLRRQYRDDPAKVDRLRRHLLQAYMNVVDGSSRIPGNANAARIGQGIRAGQSLAKLGGAALSSITDIANKAAAIRYYNGDGILSPVAESVSSFFDGLPKSQRRIAYDLAGVGMDGIRGDIAARFSAEDGVAGAGQGLLRWFFKLNLLTPWTDANKAGLGLLFARHLAMQTDRGFDRLPERTRFLLGEFGMDARHWQIARKATRQAEDGRVYLFPEEVRNLADEDFTKAGLRPADKDFIETALRSMIVDIVEAGVPTPGARERAILTAGLPPGTPAGEAARFVMQFKAFPVTVVSKTLGRMVYGNPDGKADKVGLAAFMASATILGYAAMVAKDLAKGRSPRDPKDHMTWVAAMTQGGGAGIFGDFLLGETNRFGRSLTDTLVGPTFGTISDVDELRARLIAGDDTAAAAFRLAMNNAPFVNLFYTRLAMEYLFLNQIQESLNPGYLRRAERRMLKEQGQTYILPPPSSVIPRGGQLLSQPFAGVR